MGFTYFTIPLHKEIKKWLDQIQYKAAKLVGGALHYTSQHKLELDMGWESIKNKAEVLGLTVYHRIHFNKTRRLVQQCLTGLDNRNNGIKRLRYPQLGKKFNSSYFPLFTKL